MRTATVTLAAAATGAVAGLGYAMLEARAFTLRRYTLPVLPPGHDPLTVLHVSDIHLTRRQHRKLNWVQGLADFGPDLVISTGDSLAAGDAVQSALEAHRWLLTRPGAFVLGSNDYFGPRRKNPARYLLPNGGKRHFHGPPLPTGDLIAGFRDAGWLDLTNARGSIEVRGTRVDLVGVDDPHLQLDRYARVSAPADPDAALTIGIAHAPYRRVLDAMAADGADLLLAGHTHGGQLCLPVIGTLVTNCDLPRGQARGLSRWPRPKDPDDVRAGGGPDGGPDGPEGDRLPAQSPAGGRTDGQAEGRGPAWLHVSAGVGTSPYAPVRFACRPEASLLTLVPRPA